MFTEAKSRITARSTGRVSAAAMAEDLGGGSFQARSPASMIVVDALGRVAEKMCCTRFSV